MHLLHFGRFPLYGFGWVGVVAVGGTVAVGGVVMAKTAVVSCFFGGP